MSDGSPIVFVSYSPEDAPSTSLAWIDRVIRAVTPLLHQGAVRVFSDRDLRPGEVWSDALEQAVRSCDAAILLIGPAFLASDFIRTRELPPLLLRAYTEKVVLIPVLVRDCALDVTVFKYPDPSAGPYSTSLGALQFLHERSTPLNGLTEAQQDNVFRQIVELIAQTLVPTPAYLPPASQEQRPNSFANNDGDRLRAIAGPIGLADEDYLRRVAIVLQRDVEMNFIDAGASEWIGDFDVPSMQSYVSQLVRGKRPTLTIVLGDFGSGKSTHAVRLASTLAAERVRTNSGPIPILVPLFRYAGHRGAHGLHIDQAIIGYLRDIFGLTSPFWADVVGTASTSPICFILDGFDEIRGITSRLEAIIEFDHIISSLWPNGHIVMMSRPAILSDTASGTLEIIKSVARQVNAAKVLNVLGLKPFSDSEIEAYLKQPGLRRLGRIFQSRDSKELLRRPIILSLLSSYSAAPKVDVATVTEEELLHKSIEDLLLRRRAQLQTPFPYNFWRRLLEDCAEALLKTNALELSSAELTTALRPLIMDHDVTPTSLTMVAFDLEVRTVLSISGSGIRFGHRVVRDFLAAFALARRLIHPGPSDGGLDGIELEPHQLRYIRFAIRILMASGFEQSLGFDQPPLPKPLLFSSNGWAWIAPGLGIVSDHSPNAKASRKLKHFPHGYWIGATPVTIGEYKNYCDRRRAEPIYAREITPDSTGVPLTRVTHSQSVALARDMYAGRLPSEAEWERAAGWVDLSFPQDDQLVVADAWSVWPPRVRRARANPWGVHDGTGSVWQWTGTQDQTSRHFTCKGAWWGASRDELLDPTARLNPRTMEREHVRTGFRIVVDSSHGIAQ